jgi:hypothetical protein
MLQLGLGPRILQGFKEALVRREVVAIQRLRSWSTVDGADARFHGLRPALTHGAHRGEGQVLAILAMLRVAQGGSASPIPFAARRGEALPGWGGIGPAPAGPA